MIKNAAHNFVGNGAKAFETGLNNWVTTHVENSVNLIRKHSELSDIPFQRYQSSSEEGLKRELSIEANMSAEIPHFSAVKELPIDLSGNHNQGSDNHHI